ncbi:hypothetical protein [Desulfovibrio inopinatus]|uniref:hypothetical protein n=1 Tax=Desulfovibrio inopinatus TaxID=102109 RepID=UPI0004842124|nr:hypothetical protein [Desulfovibrio inopinatus]
MKNYSPWEKKVRTRSSTPWRRAMTMGKAYAPVGVLVGGYVSMTAQGGGWGWFFVFAGVAAFVAGFAMWLAFVSVKPTVGRGIVAGAFAGIVSHWLCWLFSMIFWRFTFLTMHMPLSSLGEAPMTMFEVPLGAGVFSLWSLFIFGAVTIPAGAFIGGVVGFIQKKSVDAARGASTDV